MIVVLEGSAATHGDEPRIPDLGEDHQFAHLSLVPAKGRSCDSFCLDENLRSIWFDGHSDCRVSHAKPAIDMSLMPDQY
jgi:hypothetical protein